MQGLSRAEDHPATGLGVRGCQRRPFACSRAPSTQQEEQTANDGHDHSAALDDCRLSRDVRHPQLGRGLLRCERQGERRGPPHGPRERRLRSQGAGRRGAASRHHPAAAHSLHRRAARSGRAFERSVQESHHRARVQGQLPGRLPHQGQPAPLRRRDAGRRGSPVQLRPRGGVQAGAAGGDGARAGRGRTHHLQWLQGRGVRGDRALRVKARPQGGDGGREAHRAFRSSPRSRAGRASRHASASGCACPRGALASGKPRAETVRSSGCRRPS